MSIINNNFKNNNLTTYENIILKYNVFTAYKKFELSANSDYNFYFKSSENKYFILLSLGASSNGAELNIHINNNPIVNVLGSLLNQRKENNLLLNNNESLIYDNDTTFVSEGTEVDFFYLPGIQNKNNLTSGDSGKLDFLRVNDKNTKFLLKITNSDITSQNVYFRMSYTELTEIEYNSLFK
jgi:hypothetical protein